MNSNIDLGINFNDYLKGMDSVEDNVLERYKSLAETDSVFPFVFDVARPDGNLEAREGDCTIILKNQDINGIAYDTYTRAYKLRRRYNVKIINIDEENKVIYVSHVAARETDRDRLNDYLQENIENKVACVIPATVIAVYNHIAILNLGGLNIPGYLSIEEWSSEYTLDLRTEVKRNDIIRIAVLETGGLTVPRQKQYFKWTDQVPYRCSRRKTIKVNPWTGISKRIHEEDIVRVRCSSVADNNFYCKVEGLPEINAYCFYPAADAKLKRADIIPGCLYEGFVKKLDEEKRILRVRVFSRMEEK